MIKTKIVELSVIDDIGLFTINNKNQNLIDEPEFADLDVVRNWLDGYHIKGLIIKGNNRHFSNGANIENIKKNGADKSAFLSSIKKGHEILDFISSIKIPVVGMVCGVCFGAGLEIALSTHIRISSDNSFFSFPEVNHGIMPGFSGTVRLLKKLGYSKALDLILSGSIINAETALRIGLVDYVVPKEQQFDFTMDYIKKLTKNKGLDVINSVIESLNNAITASEKDAINMEAVLFTELAQKLAH